jgi:acetoin utilization deacetylase AcuC-like enzyme
MRRITAIPVFFDPRMVADAESYSPSAAKPARVVESWQKIGLPIELRPVQPVTAEELSLAHHPDMVRDILACQMENGFGNTLEAVARSLPYTSGAMLAAAREAIRNRCVAVAPVSGFHHAGYDHPGGFCTFNGLIVTSQVLLRGGAVSKVGIVDFDQHYGDGTEDCIHLLKLKDRVRHFTAGRIYRSSEQAGEFLTRIPSILGAMQDCDVVLYQAGADPHVDDPLGGWLTDEQLAYRDQAVFDAARALDIPVAWNLAGGYQDPIENVLAIHDETLKACARIYLRR